jgi:hypothetical protein
VVQLPDGLSDDARKVLAVVAKEYAIAYHAGEINRAWTCERIAASLGVRLSWAVIDGAVRFEKIGEAG